MPFLAAIFSYYEQKFAKLPLLSLEMLRSSTVVGILLSTIVMGYAFYEATFVLPQLLEIFRGLSPGKLLFHIF
jgi:hypothetical protein